jgi:polysaccharide deacetylase 2 family uncharacterized protein YibQ
VTLAIVLLAVGFACSRQNRATHVREPAATAAPESTPAAVPVATAPPATEAPATPEPLPTESPSSEPSATPSAPAAAEHQNAGGPKLAIIIDDCGQWPTTERGFIALPIALTLSVLPDVRFNHTIEKEAADAGKGVMLHIPMETVSGMNPGPGKITTEMTDDAIKAQVAHDLADVDLAQGANNHEGSKATSDHRTMEAVMSALAADHRFFIDSKTIGSSVAESVAREHGMLAAARDVFLDNKADVAYTEGQLREAVAIAKRDGSAIAIGHPRPTTLAALTALYPEFQAEGVDFVLAGTLVK